MALVPNVVEQTERGEKCKIFTLLLKQYFFPKDIVLQT